MKGDIKMIDFEKIHLLFGERISLLSFRFKRKQEESEIKYFYQLYNVYSFIERNYTSEEDSLGFPVDDGTFSLSETYKRYCVFRTQLFFRGSVWPAIVSGIISVITSVLLAKLHL